MTAGADLQAVTFGLDSEIFAVPVMVVREILEWRTICRLPSGPAHLLGLAEVRGEGVPVIDLRLRLGLPPRPATETTHILVLDIPLGGRGVAIGLMVDQVHDVIDIPADGIDAVPQIGVRWRSDYMRGVTRRDGRFVILLDVGPLFSGDEAAALSAA